MAVWQQIKQAGISHHRRGWDIISDYIKVKDNITLEIKMGKVKIEKRCLKL